MALWLTEGLSVRFLIYYIESGLSYPLRCIAPPPLTIRGGRGWLRATSLSERGRKEGRRRSALYGSLVQRELAAIGRLRDCMGFRYIFSEKKCNESLRKILTERQPRARGALLRYIAPPSLPRWGKVPFLSCSCSAFRMGKKDITSDALFADLCQRFYLFYRNPAFLSPPSLCDTSPFQKGRHNEWA